MRGVKPAAASDVLLSSGRNHLTALAQTEATKHLIDVFRPAQDELQAAYLARVQAEQALGDPRIVLRFAEKDLEQVIREVAMKAHLLDNNSTTGPVFKALFPNGLDAELRPQGAAQVTSAQSLRGRLDTLPSAASLKAEVMDKFDKAIGQFKGVVDTRSAAEDKLSKARDAEQGAREKFIRAYDSNLGAIRQIYPRDRDQQNLYFDEAPVNRAAATDKGGDNGNNTGGGGTNGK